MATRKEVISDKTYITVYKNIVGSLSYMYSNRPKYWEDEASYKNLEAREIEEIMATTDGRLMFEEDKLIIKESNYREHFGLQPLSEYVLDHNEIKSILLSGDYKLIEEKVSTCADNELDIFVDVALKEKLNDRNAVEIIEQYTGLELNDDIKALTTVEPTKEKSTTGRAKREKVAK